MNVERCTMRCIFFAGIFCLIASLGAPAAAGAMNWLDDPLWASPPLLSHRDLLVSGGEDLICEETHQTFLKLSLSNAIDLALCHNPQIRGAWARIKQQVAGVGEARASYMPTLSSAISRLRTHTVYPDTEGTDSQVKGNRSSASLNWRLFDFGARDGNTRSANLLLDAAMASHDAVLQKTMSTVVGAYFDALAARGAVEARIDSRRVAEQTLEATVRREQLGVAAKNDRLQAMVALARAKLAEKRAIGDHSKAIAILSAEIGLAPGSEPALAEEAPQTKAEVALDLNYLLHTVEELHPALRSTRLQVEAAQAKIQAARAEGRPTLDASWNYYRNGYPNQAFQTGKVNVSTVGVTLNLPLFEGFGRTYRVNGAQAQLQQSEAQHLESRQQIIAEIVKAYADTVSSRANLDASVMLLSAAQEALNSTLRRYDKGAADVLELLNSQSSFADARQESVRCHAEWRSSKLRLLANLGHLTRETVR